MNLTTRCPDYPKAKTKKLYKYILHKKMRPIFRRFLYYEIIVWAIEYFKSCGVWYGFINVALVTLGNMLYFVFDIQKNTFLGEAHLSG